MTPLYTDSSSKLPALFPLEHGDGEDECPWDTLLQNLINTLPTFNPQDQEISSFSFNPTVPPTEDAIERISDSIAHIFERVIETPSEIPTHNALTLNDSSSEEMESSSFLDDFIPNAIDAEDIRTIRREKNWTQNELADAVLLPGTLPTKRKIVYGWENGEHPGKYTAALQKIINQIGKERIQERKTLSIRSASINRFDIQAILTITGLSTFQLAKKIETNNGTVSRWLHGSSISSEFKEKLQQIIDREIDPVLYQQTKNNLPPLSSSATINSETITAIQQAKNWNREKLAKRLQTTKEQISRWAHGLDISEQYKTKLQNLINEIGEQRIQNLQGKSQRQNKNTVIRKRRRQDGEITQQPSEKKPCNTISHK